MQNLGNDNEVVVIERGHRAQSGLKECGEKAPDSEALLCRDSINRTAVHTRSFLLLALSYFICIFRVPPFVALRLMQFY